MNFILFLLPLVFAFPSLELSFEDESQGLLAVQVVGRQQEFLEQCVSNGLEVRYRYHFELCKRRGYWFDGCLKGRREIHRLNFDPISETYKITVDRHRDGADPSSQVFDSLDAAVSEMSRVKSLPVDFLSHGDVGYLTGKNAYLSVRVESRCRGDYNKTLARISYFLSLGLVEIPGFDSGWVDFTLPGGRYPNKE